MYILARQLILWETAQREFRFTQEPEKKRKNVVDG